MIDTDPPEAWRPARRLALQIVGPLERFLRIEAASGVVLLLSALGAFAWANSAWHGAYAALWSTPLELRLGPLHSEETLRFWVNDVLMVLFFFLVGLEIRREIHAGELSRWRRAALPVAAALGGMLVPAVVYAALNPAGVSSRGWAVPMATDIAFAVGVLALLGNRVPAALRVLLLALAVIDDVGAILVIAIFYSGHIDPAGLAVAAGGVVAIFAQQRLGVRGAIAYVPAGIVVWLGMHEAGIHPTLTGVVIGLMTPVRTWLGDEDLGRVTGDAVSELRHRRGNGSQFDHGLIGPADRLAAAGREAVPPVVRLEAALHGWVAYLVMPLFALANAGVPLGDMALDQPGATTVAAGVLVGLVAGKPLGILGASFIAVRLRVASLPRGVTWPRVALVGIVGGVGFTMSIFLASLGLEGSLLEVGKASVLGGSAVAAVLALLAGRAILGRSLEPEVARTTATQAERSTVA